MKLRRVLSVIMAIAIVVSCVYATGSLIAAGADSGLAATSAYQEMLAQTSDADYGLAPTVNEGTILQAWNWSFKNIEANLELVAKQGFTTIQVSPPNEIKETTSGIHILEGTVKNGWWMFYQPAGFQLNNSSGNALGTKDEFISMCSKAHEYGIKIIVDAVINHMGTCDNEDYITSEDPMDHLTPKAQVFEPEIVAAEAFHKPWAKMTYKEDAAQFSQYDSTYDLTRNCTSRLPDLDTSTTVVQKAIYDYMDELLAAGADGFRFDAAKHIETADDISGLKSDFWAKTLGAVRTKYKDECEVYAYGEILNTCGVNRPFSMYTKLFDVTDSSTFYAMRDVVTSGNGDATPYYPSSNFTSENVILWDESHDTYIEEQTAYLNVTQRGKIWALCAGRAGITTVYFARPDDGTDLSACYNILLGEARKTAWSNSTTKAINQFHNYFLGQDEYCTSNQNGWAYIERGTTGAVIVGRGNNNGGSVYLTNHKLQNGTYKDAVTGNSFYVVNGVIRGVVGNTGVACIYYDSSEVPTQAPNDDVVPTKSGCYTIIYDNSIGLEGPFYLYYWKTGGQGPVDWPGLTMNFYEMDEDSHAMYYGFIPEGYDNLIVSNGSVQTVDTRFSGHSTVRMTTLSGDKYNTQVTPLSVTNPTEVTGRLLGDTDKNGTVNIFDVSFIQKGLTGTAGYPDYTKMDAGNIEYRVADADGDRTVNIFDAALIQKFISGAQEAQSYGIGKAMK